MPLLTSELISHGALAAFAVTLLSRLGLPIPASPLYMLAGSLGWSGAMPWPAVAMVAAVAVLANLIGAEAWFLAGRRWGYPVLRLLCKVSLSPDACVTRSELLLGRWGGWSLVVAQFLPGVSMIAAPVAGALKMHHLRFVAFQLVASAAWVLAFVALGVAFGSEINKVLAFLADTGVAAAVVLAALLIFYATFLLWRRRAAALALQMPRITPAELRRMMALDVAPLIVDLRPAAIDGADLRTIPGALRIDLPGLRRAASTWPTDRDIVLFCDCPHEASAVRGAQVLGAHGFANARPLAGGFSGWLAKSAEESAETAAIKPQMSASA